LSAESTGRKKLVFKGSGNRKNNYASIDIKNYDENQGMLDELNPYSKHMSRHTRKILPDIIKSRENAKRKKAN